MDMMELACATSSADDHADAAGVCGIGRWG